MGASPNGDLNTRDLTGCFPDAALALSAALFTCSRSIYLLKFCTCHA